MLACAAAADYVPLSGSLSVDEGPGYTRWDGFEAGGAFGRSNMITDFGDSTSSMVAYMLCDTMIENEFSPSSWATLPKDVSNSGS